MVPMVLVTYATRYGSTAEVAQAVAETLNSGGISSICKPIPAVKQVDEYRALVLGAPLFMGRLHSDARKFLSAHRALLTKIPVALFVSGPVQKDEKDWIGAEQQLDKELTKYPWLSLLARKIVGGKFDPAMLTFPLSLIATVKKMPASDVRDWPAIRSWASALAVSLQPVLQP